MTNSVTYKTFEKKVVYAFSVINKDGKLDYYDGLRKVGDTSIDNFKTDLRDDSDDLKNIARKRIKQYAGTSGLPYSIDLSRLAVKKDDTFYRDYDVHKVLQRSGIEKEELGEGNEWYRASLETIIEAIKAVEDGRNTITSPEKVLIEDKIVFRPEQLEAIKKTGQVFKKKNKMLWNAKMRFGKTLSALQVVKENNLKKTLIITHRPVVSQGWFEDFSKIFKADDKYLFGSKEKGEKIDYLKKAEDPYVYFASIQDLRGLSTFGGKHTTENIVVAEIEWDCIIIDEAHEGTRTDLAKNVLSIIGKKAKVLELSGTPFNILDDYEEDQVFTWDYVMEQEAKLRWEKEKPNELNPYETLPKVNMYTFELKNIITDKEFFSIEDKAFNFMEFFRTKEEDKFVYEEKINQFLNEITKDNKNNNYPYSTEEFRNNLRHTLWLLPSVSSCKALKNLLDKHPIFSDYEIINVVDDGKEDGESKTDVDRVKKAITDKPHESKTITLSVRKLTTGVTIKEWTGVVFLNNTNSPSAYLQAAFRAQTPFVDPINMGIKTNSYVFDFAPDRALTVMTEAAKLNSGVGKKTTNLQKEQMQKFLNFLPILGETGHGMAEYDVDSLLTKLKVVYAEKAVRTGFDDDSLYNDELLTLNDVDLNDFKELKAIIGSSNSSKLPTNIDINKQGLSDEEYDRAERSKNKKAKDRTEEEIEALKKLRESKKQRKTMISILRGISIRIPLMIYGMEIDVADDIDINRFVDEVDEISWLEFMPDKITKRLFKRYAKYYDNEVFIEAGRIIRSKAKSYDNLGYMDRTEKLADLFGSFKNPDKETVLTPWRVVNMHLATTIGGLCYFDENFENSSSPGKSIRKWIETDITNQVYSDDARILEINSKTGLYPLFVVNSLFYKRMYELSDSRAGVFNKFDEELLIKEILEKNVFVLAKTKMARTITQRTLAGYNSWNTNISFIENLTTSLKKEMDKTIKIIEGEFDNMKFDVIIGNPPYSESDGGAGSSSTPTYNNFIDAAKKLEPKYLSFIIPSRWFIGGKGLDSFRDEMLKDVHIKSIYDWTTPQDIFPKTEIKGGVMYFLWDKKYNNSNNLVKVSTYENKELLQTSYRNLRMHGADIFVRYQLGFNILEKIFDMNVPKPFENTMSKYISSRKPFGLGTDFDSTVNFKNTSVGLNSPIKCYAKKNKIGYVEESDVKVNDQWIPDWKVIAPYANNIGTDANDDNLNTIVIEPYSICTETYILFGINLISDEKSAENLAKYLKTKFSRFLNSLAKITQHGTSKTYIFVPVQNFSSDSDINWSQGIEEIDQQLYRKYGLNDNEIKFVESKIKLMDIVK
ncbi:Eco57I restriction-modification methylase domain-containing protein [Vagococcus fluvialis]|uniref:Eco57I restriction-modification methylase domain-containing protein n=1 Tax=Vagococcus fluvialis TaxID=2738 RepID=UPI003D14219F